MDSMEYEGVYSTVLEFGQREDFKTKSMHAYRTRGLIYFILSLFYSISVYFYIHVFRNEVT